MFVKCVKNYISSLKYILAVLGIIFIGLLAGGSFMYKETTVIVEKMTSDISGVTGNADIDGNELAETIRSCLRGELGYADDGLVSGNTLIIDDNGDGFVSITEAEDAIIDSVSSAVSDNFDNYADHVTEIGSVLTDVIRSLLKVTVIFVIIQILALVIARAVAVFMARKELEHRGRIRLGLTNLLHDILMLVFGTAAVYAVGQLPMLGFIFAILYPLLYVLVSLPMSNLSLSRKHRASLKNAMDISGILMLFTCNIVEMIITCLLTYFIMAELNIVVACCFCAAFMIVAATSITISADMICMDIAKDRDSVKEKVKEAEDLDMIELDEDGSGEKDGSDDEYGSDEADVPGKTNGYGAEDTGSDSDEYGPEDRDHAGDKDE